MLQEIYQKEFSIGRILTEAWTIFQDNFRNILLIAVLFYLPLNFILNQAPPALDIDPNQENFLDAIKTNKEGIDALKATSWIYSIIEVFLIIAIASLVQNSINNQPIVLKEIFQKARKKWWQGGLIFIERNIGLFFLFLLFIVPGIIYYVYWYFALFAVILADQSYKDGLKYSKEIVRGRWWKTTGYILVFFILSILVSYSLGFIIYNIIPLNYQTPIFDLFFNTIIDVVSVYFIVVSTLFFINFDSTKIVIANNNENNQINPSKPPSKLSKLFSF